MWRQDRHSRPALEWKLNAHIDHTYGTCWTWSLVARQMWISNHPIERDSESVATCPADYIIKFDAVQNLIEQLAISDSSIMGQLTHSRTQREVEKLAFVDTMSCYFLSSDLRSEYIVYDRSRLEDVQKILFLKIVVTYIHILLSHFPLFRCFARIPPNISERIVHFRQLIIHINCGQKCRQEYFFRNEGCKGHGILYTYLDEKIIFKKLRNLCLSFRILSAKFPRLQFFVRIVWSI